MSGNYWAIDEFQVGKTDRIRVAVKDLIDLGGYKTSAGSRVVLANATPAVRDALCMDSLRNKDIVIVGKANLVELAFGTSGINPWFGTPINPFGSELIPGGSSSGSAVAVAGHIADFALGTDTGGSIRIPAAACGLVGLKTTWSKISLQGVRALAPSLDTVGPIARTVEAIKIAQNYLDPADVNESKISDEIRIGLVIDSQPLEMTTVFRELFSELGWKTSDISSLGLANAHERASRLLRSEAYFGNGSLLRESHRLDPFVARRLLLARDEFNENSTFGDDWVVNWKRDLEAMFSNFDVLALATVPYRIPKLSAANSVVLNANTLPFNLSGNPAISIPISNDFMRGTLHKAQSPQGGSISSPVPVSLQLVGALGSERTLIRIARLIEDQAYLYSW